MLLLAILPCRPSAFGTLRFPVSVRPLGSMAGTAALDELTPHIDIEDFFINIVEATEARAWHNQLSLSLVSSLRSGTVGRLRIYSHREKGLNPRPDEDEGDQTKGQLTEAKSKTKSPEACGSDTFEVWLRRPAQHYSSLDFWVNVCEVPNLHLSFVALQTP